MMNETLQQKYESLCSCLRNLNRVAVAYSGGVDSALLLYAAHQTLGENVLAVTAVGEMVPKSELLESQEFAKQYHIPQHLLPVDVFTIPAFVQNLPDRCYHCKRFLFEQIQAVADAQQMTVIEGSNLDDLSDYRPGRKALAELNIISPFLEAGLTKGEIRALSRVFHLPTWDKPSCACLASRVPYYTELTQQLLHRIDAAEDILRTFGIKQLRVRCQENTARIETDDSGFPVIAQNRQQIAQSFRSLGLSPVSLDLEPYRTGRLNETQPEILGKIVDNPACFDYNGCQDKGE